MKAILDGVEYDVQPIPPSMSLYHIRINELLKREPKNAQEVKDATGELDVLMTELLKECVKPEPAKAHQLTLFNLVMKVTDQAIKDAQFFWDQKQPGASTSSSASANPAQASQ
jgi:hypothetical protein